MSIKHAFTSAKGDGADATLVRPIDWNAAHTGWIASGSYTGDSSSNRAIAHGSGAVPALTWIWGAGGYGVYVILGANPSMSDVTGTGTSTVTAATATNFYVGGAATSYSGNYTNITYYWYAIG